MTGRTRHILIDTIGPLLTVHVQAANIADRDGAKLLLAGPGARFPRLAMVGVDGAYQRPCAPRITSDAGLDGYGGAPGAKRVWGGAGQAPPERPAGFQVLPRRRVVERTFAWLGRNRRLSTDYEVPAATEEAWISLAMSHMMRVRLARCPLLRHPLR